MGEGYRIRGGGCCPDCNNSADNPCDFMKDALGKDVCVRCKKLFPRKKIEGTKNIACDKCYLEVFNIVMSDLQFNKGAEGDSF